MPTPGVLGNDTDADGTLTSTVCERIGAALPRQKPRDTQLRLLQGAGTR